MLEARRVECPGCHQKVDLAVQFYFGACTLDEYEIGDRLRWGQWDEGVPGHRLVVTYGVAIEACSRCGEDGPDAFDIFVENDVLTHARFSIGEFNYSVATDPNCAYFVLDDYPASVQFQPEP